jgi:hypothetical protein
LLLVPLAALLIAGCAGPNVSPTLTVTQTRTETPELILPRPPKVNSPGAPLPIAMTPQIAKQMATAVEAGESPRFALMCFETQDRLTYHNWVNELIASLASYRALVEAYEDRIRKRQEGVKP